MKLNLTCLKTFHISKTPSLIYQMKLIVILSVSVHLYNYQSVAVVCCMYKYASVKEELRLQDSWTDRRTDILTHRHCILWAFSGTAVFTSLHKPTITLISICPKCLPGLTEIVIIIYPQTRKYSLVHCSCRLCV